MILRDICGVGQAKPHPLRELVEPGLGDHLTEHLAVEADRVCLVRRQRMSELTADLLQAVVIGLPELWGLDFSLADRRQCALAEAVKNVVDAPDGKTAGKHGHDHAHDGSAEPVFGDFADAAKHGSEFGSKRLE